MTQLNIQPTSGLHADFDPAPVARWLTGDGFVEASTTGFIEKLAKRLRRAGLPVDRMTTHLPVLHPLIFGQSVLWRHGEAPVLNSIEDSPSLHQQVERSPLHVAYMRGANTRVRISPNDNPGPYPIVDDLRAAGYTDYACYAVRFSDNTHKALTVSTKTPAGFDDAALARFEQLFVHIGPILEIRGRRAETVSLLETYIGPTAGQKVLEGRIRGGQGEVIRSVIWFSDMRGFTELAARLPGPEMIALLNDFFGAITGAVNKHGGEVMKFIGDSVLAIFPCDTKSTSQCEASHRAELAAWDAAAAVAELNRTAAQRGYPEIDYGIALHIGEVFYGNVGGQNRLDFTVIGSAVNLASRIEGLTRDIDGKILASQDFADISKSAYRQVGAFRLKGVAGWSNVWAPDGLES